MLQKSIGFNSVLLAVFALVTAGIVAITYQSTFVKIADSKLRAAQAKLFEIIPANAHDNDLFTDTLAVPEEMREFLGLTSDSNQDNKVHIARRNSEPFAAIIPSVAPDGYSGPIKMLVGVNADGTIAGVRVTDHRETPGLGDYVDVRKSNWILSFNGKALGARFEDRTRVVNADGEVQEFDQMTGATITRTAVIRQIKKSLSFFQIMDPLTAARISANTDDSDDAALTDNTSGPSASEVGGHE